MKCPVCNKDCTNEKWCEFCGASLGSDCSGANYQGAFSANEEFVSDCEYVNVLENEDADTQQAICDADICAVEENKEKKENKGLKITITVLIVAVTIAVAVLILAVCGVFDSGSGSSSPKSKSTSDSAISVDSSGKVLENEERNTLFETGEYYIGMGDYVSAETVYKTIIDKYSDSKDAQLLYNILYNYNRSAKKLESKKYEDARAFFNKIPKDYVKYDNLKEAVEALDDEIILYERANLAFENLEEYINDGDYEGGAEIIESIDETYLSQERLKALDGYKADINKALNGINENEDDNGSYSENVSLDSEYAEYLIRDYLKAYVNAINENNFEIVSPYISGNLYTAQKNQVTARAAEGQKEEFNFVILNSLRNVGYQKWEADVNESLTVIYADKTREDFEKFFTYTVQYIDGTYYLTDVKKTEAIVTHSKIHP